MFTVVYIPECGRTEVFGYFNTEMDAVKWMNSDVEFNIENAKKNAVELIAKEVSPTWIEIENYGTWNVVKVTPVGL